MAKNVSKKTTTRKKRPTKKAIQRKAVSGGKAGTSPAKVNWADEPISHLMKPSVASVVAELLTIGDLQTAQKVLEIHVSHLNNPAASVRFIARTRALKERVGSLPKVYSALASEEPDQMKRALTTVRAMVARKKGRA